MMSILLGVKFALSLPASAAPCPQDASKTAQAQGTSPVAPFAAATGAAAYITVPDCISEQRLDRYAVILDLSAAQHMAAKASWEVYLQGCESLGNDLVPKMRGLSIEAGNLLAEQGYSPVTVSTFLSLDQLREDFTKRQARQDDQLFEEIQSTLTDDQLRWMNRVRMHRQRERSKGVLYEMYAARIDLTQIVESTDLPEDALPTLDPLLYEYETEITPIIVRLRAVENPRVQKLRKVLSDTVYDEQGKRRDFADPSQDHRSQAAFDDIKRIQNTSASLQRQISGVNRNFLPRILDALAPPQRDEIAWMYQTQAYPKVYPDPLDPKGVFDAVVSRRELNSEQRSMVVSLWVEVSRENREIARRMESEVDDWQEKFAKTRSLEGFEEYQNSLRRLRDQRWQKDRELVSKLPSIIPPEVVSIIADSIRQYQADADRLVQLAENDSYPGF